MLLLEIFEALVFWVIDLFFWVGGSIRGKPAQGKKVVSLSLKAKMEDSKARDRWQVSYLIKRINRLADDQGIKIEFSRKPTIAEAKETIRQLKKRKLELENQTIEKDHN